MAQIVLSNGREFASQKAAKDHFRAILHSYANGEQITDGSHHEDLAALLERYDNAITATPSKIGAGIDHFERRINTGSGYSTPGFWVVRTDGSSTDFSLYVGISAKPKPQSQEFADACRGVVADDLRAAKRHHFQVHGDADGCVLCDLSDEPISFDEAHLDHAYPPFGVMVVMFRAAQGWHDEIPAGILSVGQDQQTTTTFVDPNTAAQFRAFHHRGARLRVISARSNLEMASSQRAPKIKRPVPLGDDQ